MSSALDSSCQLANAGSSCTNITDASDCSCCRRCVDCEDTTCSDSINDCEAFLANIFVNCKEEVEEEGGGAIVGIIVAILCIGGCAVGVCCLCLRKNGGAGGSQELNERQQRRLGMAACNCKGHLSLQLHGTYLENGETKPTTYTLTIDVSGNVMGTAQDDDGSAQVTGKLYWAQDLPHGQIMWQESGSQTLEAEGTFSFNGSAYVMQAQYVSSYQNTHGQTLVQSAPMAVAGATVVTGTVVTGSVVGQSTNLPGEVK